MSNMSTRWLENVFVKIHQSYVLISVWLQTDKRDLFATFSKNDCQNVFARDELQLTLYC